MVDPLTDGGGTHLILNFQANLFDSAIEQAAQQSGFNLMSTKPYYASTTKSGQYIVPFASVDQNSIDNVVKSFALALQKQSGRSNDAN